MDFQTAVKTCLTKYVDFSGRAARSEYWWFALFILLGSFVAGLIDGFLGLGASGGLVGALFGIGTLLPSLAAGVRRLHDLDKSGWWMLLVLVPLIGALVLIFFFIQRGTAGSNRFGSDPL